MTSLKVDRWCAILAGVYRAYKLPSNMQPQLLDRESAIRCHTEENSESLRNNNRVTEILVN